MSGNSASPLFCFESDCNCALQGTEAHAQSFAKKSNALANALHHQGRTAAALQRLGTGIALLAQLPQTPAAVLQYLVQSLVHLRSTCPRGQSSAGAITQAKPRGRGARASAKGHRQKSVLENMQADAAGELPVGAPVAAYLQQLQSPVSAAVQGRVTVMELKALHQVQSCWLGSCLVHIAQCMP